MEKETGAKIIIRGKGSVKEGKVGRKDGQPLPGEDEPLHAFITASNPDHVKKAVEKIKDVIRQGIEVPEGHNDLRRMQLRELAQLNGTLRETDSPRCSNCGSSEHKSWLCPDKPNITNNIVCSSCGGAGHIAKDCRSKRPGQGGPPAANNQAKIDEEYMSLMAELGEAPPPDAQIVPPQQMNRPFAIFEPRSLGPPRPLMAPPQQQVYPPQMPMQVPPSVPPMPPHTMAPWNQPPPPGNDNMVPPPPGTAPLPARPPFQSFPPAPPGTGPPPQWNGNQPPMMPPQPPQPWMSQNSSFMPPPPPGVQPLPPPSLTSMPPHLLSAPPPPPPPSG